MELRWCSADEIYKLFEDPFCRKDYKEENYKYLHLGRGMMDADTLFCVAFVKDYPAGFLQLRTNPKNKKNYWMNFVTVHPKYRQQNIARSLLTEMCRYLSTIEEATLDLSTYEKEGEVLISSVHELATQYPSLKIKHRVWGGPEQEAINVFLKRDDRVYIEDPDQNFKGWGKIMYLDEYTQPLQITVRISEEEVLKTFAKNVLKKE